MALLRPPFRKWVITGALLAALLLTHSFWLAALGRRLVLAEQPVPADIAVVLAGDYLGLRVLKGAELVRQQYTSKVLVSGPVGMYGFNEAELAIPFAVRSGYPASWFVAAQNESRSTREEALALAPELRRRGVRTCLLVTSDYHTRRAARTFRSAVPGIEFHAIAASYPFFNADTWWRSREGRKTVLLEWLKTVAEWLGM